MQYGFVKNRSTNDVLTFISNVVYYNLDNSYPNFFDLAKGFDTVKHSILLDKLENYGIRGPALELIESYLTGGQQLLNLANVKVLRK